MPRGKVCSSGLGGHVRPLVRSSRRLARLLAWGSSDCFTTPRCAC
uniref:Uncharacterized protein n=1 Tax=Arundo donax TaxID=35708 RepID=A0A0A9FU00_ARUDO